MKILSVYDREFCDYGQIMEGYDTSALIEEMRKIPMPDSGVAYEPGISALEACSIFSELRDRAYGGMPIQLGMCWGFNSKLNALEYHRDSEINIPVEDLVLLLARRSQITDGKLDTSLVKAFRVPAGIPVEIYASTLHYAPCHTDNNKGFRMAVVLPCGTNYDKPQIAIKSKEDRRMLGRNKWLLAHPDSEDAAKGAYIGLYGENIDIS